jgi:hypothetical protein
MADQELQRRPLYGWWFPYHERWVLSDIAGTHYVRHEHFFPFATLGLKDYVSNVLESVPAEQFLHDQSSPWLARQKLEGLRLGNA